MIRQKVVRNDHVLAIVKLKEEELERQEQALKDSMNVNDTASTTSKAKDCSEIVTMENAVPKLTRSKARALNKYPLPVPPFKHSESDSEVVALIREELHSDDDDEEYQPGEDDVEVYCKLFRNIFQNVKLYIDSRNSYSSQMTM